jgi:hypothetical protein
MPRLVGWRRRALHCAAAYRTRLFSLDFPPIGDAPGVNFEADLLRDPRAGFASPIRAADAGAARK